MNCVYGEFLFVGQPENSNAIFELSLTPIEGSDHLYLNGLLQDEGLMFDYDLTGRIITFNIAPPIGSIILCSYRFN